MRRIDDSAERCPHCGYVPGTRPEKPYYIAPGSFLQGRYLLGKVLGSGGFGVTYIGYDTMLSRRVGVKEYLPGEFATRTAGSTQVMIYSGDKAEQFQAGKEKFLEEAGRLTKFENTPEIIHVYGCFEENNTAYMVMEYLEGESLRRKLERDGKMPVEEAVLIVFDVLHALEAVHREGMIHRDIAPDNIFLVNDPETGKYRTKLIDFAAARYATTTHSRSLTVLVKQGFAPPEQYRSRGDQGPWTDVYSLAATFYYMITGVYPQDALERKVRDGLKPPSKLGVRIGKYTETALLNAMNLNIEDRTPSAEAFEEELRSLTVVRKVDQKQKAVLAIPLWVKILVPAASVAVIAFAVLLGSGRIRFARVLPGQQVHEEGVVQVPNVINQERGEAENIAAESGILLQITDKQYSNEIPEGRVLSQVPDAGEEVTSGSALNIVISAGIEPTSIPYIIGMEEEEALKALDDAGLKVTSERKNYAMAPGTIAEVTPAVGTQTVTGTEVSVVISDGLPGADETKDEQVDDLAGAVFTDAAAQEAEKFIYLVSAGTEYSDTYAQGTIIRQETAAGTTVKQNTNIPVVVSRGPELFTIPDVQYKTQDEAIQILADAGFTSVSAVPAYDAAVQAGNVVTQSVAAGTQAAAGTQIVLTVSQGPQPQQGAPAAGNSSGSGNGSRSNRTKSSGQQSGNTHQPAQAEKPAQAGKPAQAEKPAQPETPAAQEQHNPLFDHMGY